MILSEGGTPGSVTVFRSGREWNMSNRTRLLLGVGLLSAMFMPASAPAETVSFQNGINGYAGTYDMRISDSGHVYLGSMVTQYQFDGAQADGTEVDRFGLIRFDDILGLQPGRVPLGATILSAKLVFTTSSQAENASADSDGPMGVARMLKPFDTATTWSTFGTEGPDLAGGDFDRPAGGYGDMVWDGVYDADVTSIVQAWADGEPNHGFIVIAASTDAWYIHTTGHAVENTRPKLVVEYAKTRSRAIVFQQGIDGYAGSTQIIVSQDDSSTFGETINTAYLDGFRADPAEPEIDALIKFDDVFGEEPGQISTATPIIKAYLTLTTGPRSESFQTRSKGPFFAHRMLVDCDWTGSDWSKPLLWTDFLSADGPTEADGEIGPALSSVRGMAWDARAWFDITAVAQAWQGGDANYGLNIKPGGTDGWKIHCTGSPMTDLRPQLVLIVPSKRADLDLDGDVDLADFLLLQECGSGPAVPYVAGCEIADFDSDLDVDQNDFAVYQTCYSGTQAAAPECR